MKKFFYGIIVCLSSAVCVEAGTFNELLQNCSVTEKDGLNCNDPTLVKSPHPEIATYSKSIAYLNQILKADQAEYQDHWKYHFKNDKGKLCAKKLRNVYFGPKKRHSVIKDGACGDNYVKNNFKNIESITRAPKDALKSDGQYTYTVTLMNLI